MGLETCFLDVAEKRQQAHWQLCRQTPQGPDGGLLDLSYLLLWGPSTASLPALSWVAEPARVKRG